MSEPKRTAPMGSPTRSPHLIFTEILTWFAAMGILWSSAELTPTIFLQGWDLWVFPSAVFWLILRLPPPPTIPGKTFASLWLSLLLFVAATRWGLSVSFFPDSDGAQLQIERMKCVLVPMFILPATGVRPLWQWWCQRRNASLSLSLLHGHLRTVTAIFLLLVLAAMFLHLSTLDAHWFGDGPPLQRLLNAWAIGVAPMGVIGIVIGTVVILTIIGPYMWMFSRMSRSITHRLSHTASAMSAINLLGAPEPMPVSGEDEIALLQRQYNAMAERLQQTMVVLNNKQAQLETLMHRQREITAAIGHELRTPLAVIQTALGGTEVLR